MQQESTAMSAAAAKKVCFMCGVIRSFGSYHASRVSLSLSLSLTHTHTHTVGMLLLPLHVFATSQSIETRRRRPDDETSDGTNEDGGPRSAILG